MPNSYTHLTLQFIRAGITALLDGQVDRAEVLLKTSLGLVEQREALSHPNVGECLVHLGNIKMYKRQPLEAESLFKLAAFIFQQVFGRDHINVRLAAGRASQARDAQERPQSCTLKQPAENNNLRYLPVLYRANAFQVVPYAVSSTQLFASQETI